VIVSREARISALAPYVRRLADLLELRDWHLELKYSPPEDSSQATIFLTNGRKRADLHLCYEFFDMTPEEQRQCLCHELVHCHFGAVGFMVEEENDAKTYRAFVRLLEYGIDAMADAIAPHMPLPPGVKTARPKPKR
jgi:hypothetical protein